MKQKNENSSMDNPFKQIEPTDSLPKEAKREALGNIFSIKLVMDVLDLFIAKIGAAATDSLTMETEPSTEEEDQTPPDSSPNLLNP